MAIADVQHRYRELGRIRLGEKQGGRPAKLDTFRLTSPSEELLKHASGFWGGIPQPWDSAPGEAPQWELVTESKELEVYVPQQNVAGKQLLELYTRGGVQRRCDGDVELITGKPCMCDPNERACTPTTHVLFILPQLPDVGVWRLTTHGWNAAAELPGTVDLLRGLAGEGVLPAAVLALEVRTSVAQGQTRHYPVPVLRVPYSLAALQQGGVPVLEAAPTGKPPIGERGELPDDASFTGAPPLGDAPGLPSGDSGPEGDGPQDEGGVVVDGEGAATPPVSDDEWQQAFDLLVSVCDGSLSRAATYVNKGSRTNYTQRTLGDATLPQLEAGILVADR